MPGFLEAVPLILFLFFVNRIDTQIPMNWKLPFWVSGLAALLVILGFLYRKILINRVFLGINLYLITGALAFVTGQWWLNDAYGHFQASGMIVWIIIVGVLSTLISPHGFVGADPSEGNRVTQMSGWLILLSLGAFAISYAFRGERFYSEILPFGALFVGQTFLKRKVKAEKDEV